MGMLSELLRKISAKEKDACITKNCSCIKVINRKTKQICEKGYVKESLLPMLDILMRLFLCP